MTVRQNIEFARRYHRTGRQAESGRTEQLAEVLGVGHLLNRYPRTLSGGERQRVALARAISIRPRLMFLDEPLGMLDPVTREAVASELRAWHRRFGMTTIHVTHDHTEARSLGDGVAVMLAGVLEQSGLPDEVFRRPHSSALARFLGCENMFECRAVTADSQRQVKIDLAGQTLAVSSTVVGAALACIRPEDLLVTASHKPVSPGMSESTYAGRVVEASLRGPLVRMVVESCGLRWVSLMGRSHYESLSCAPGDEVTVILSPETVHLVPQEA